MRQAILLTLAALCLTGTAAAQREITVNLENAKVKRFIDEVKYTYSSTWKAYRYKGADVTEEDEYPNPAVIELDVPAPANTRVVAVNTEDENDNYTVEFEEGSQSAEIFNLIPQQTYNYEVRYIDEYGDDVVMDEGIIHTEGRVRMMKFATIHNVRDLGGWELADGSGRTKYGLLFRGANLNSSSQADRDELLRLGVKAELDTRNLSTEPTVSPLGADIPFLFIYMVDYWTTFLPDNNEKLKQGFEFIINNLRQQRPVYFHCSVGADRTGVMAMLIEGCTGVTADNMYKDFELTTFSSFVGDRDKKNLNARALTELGYRDDTDFNACARDYMINAIGISEQDVDDMRDIMRGTYDYEDEGGETHDPEGDIATGIVTFNPDALPANAYDLAGRRVASAKSRGIVIVKDKAGSRKIVR